MLRTPTVQSRIGDILVARGLISRERLEEAAGSHPTAGSLGRYLVEQGAISSLDLSRALAHQYNLPFVDVHDYPVNVDALRHFTEEQAYRHRIFPLESHRDVLVIAMADPSTTIVLDDLRMRMKREVVPVLAAPEQIEEAIKYYYGVSFETATEEFSELLDGIAAENELEILEDVEQAVDGDEAEAAPVIRLVNAIISEAIRRRVSDIHVDPREHDILLRFRIDGVLHPVKPPPKRLQAAITSRIKIMAEMDISERRNPQDGHFKTRAGDKVIDFRVSSLPTVHGEKVVMRLLDKSNLRLDLTQLGFEASSYDAFSRAIRRPYGMVLVTGPTGSGKSTTLYSALKTIARPDINVITVEDPVEYQMDEVNQAHIRPEQGFTFAKGLRSILRQDPDVVMVGEIRDHETAEIAVRAALTGHLVLSTLHTNDAPSTLSRLVDMGIEKFLVTSSVVLIVAQRLVRKVCTRCKEAYPADDELLHMLGVYDEYQRTGARPTFFRGVGCRACNDTGYSGRLALYEVLEMTEELRRAILAGENADEIRSRARTAGMKTLRESGLAKLVTGITTVDEVVRVTFEELELVNEAPPVQ